MPASSRTTQQLKGNVRDTCVKVAGHFLTSEYSHFDVKQLVA
jgi:hypothetical protein